MHFCNFVDIQLVNSKYSATFLHPDATNKLQTPNDMKKVKFRVLRMAKCKAVVASYMQWRKVITADYGKCDLTLVREYANIPDDVFVHNHKGELLFWKDFNPEEIPVYWWEDWVSDGNFHYGINWGTSITYNCRNIDVQGVPCFSHFTADYLATHNSDIAEYEPLTAGVVKKWYGWFLLQLNNSTLIY